MLRGQGRETEAGEATSAGNVALKGCWGLGDEATLEQLEEHLGVDFAKGHITGALVQQQQSLV